MRDDYGGFEGARLTRTKFAGVGGSCGRLAGSRLGGPRLVPLGMMARAEFRGRDPLGKIGDGQF